MGNWDLADLMQMETLNDLANIPDQVRTNQFIEQQNAAIERLQAELLTLRSEFYEIANDRDGWQAQALALKDGIKQFIPEEQFEEVRQFVNDACQEYREEVRILNRSNEI